MGLIRLVACGSVDDGKSTLIGRLLADTDSVPEDTLELARTVRRAGLDDPGGRDRLLAAHRRAGGRARAGHHDRRGLPAHGAPRRPPGRDRRRAGSRAVHPQHGRGRLDGRCRASAGGRRPRGDPPDLPAPDDLRAHGRAPRDHRGEQARCRRLRPRPVLRARRRGGRSRGPPGLLPGHRHPGQRPGRGQRHDRLPAHRVVRRPHGHHRHRRDPRARRARRRRRPGRRGSRSRRSSARTGSAAWPARWSPGSSRSATRCPWRGPA